MTNVSFVFLVGAVALLALTDGRPSKPSFETEEYVISEIVKKGDINRKEQSPKAAGKLVSLNRTLVLHVLIIIIKLFRINFLNRITI